MITATEKLVWRKLQTDYGLKPNATWFRRAYISHDVGYDAATLAFLIANDWQKRGVIY